MAKKTTKGRPWWEGFSFPGFRPSRMLRGQFGDPNLRIVRLNRRSKKQFAAVVGMSNMAGTIEGTVGFATCPTVHIG